jgi:hypothetical protein
MTRLSDFLDALPDLVTRAIGETEQITFVSFDRRGALLLRASSSSADLGALEAALRPHLPGTLDGILVRRIAWQR